MSRYPEMPERISIGIHTDGKPLIQKTVAGGHDAYLLRNMAIGVGFHWQRSICALLCGELRFLDTPTVEGIGLIETLDIEDYLKSVISSEMSKDAPIEFLKAHAIVSRSWAVGKVMRMHYNGGNGKKDSGEIYVDWADTATHHGFDLCNDDHCQRYQGMSDMNPAVEEAVESTAGVILSDRNGIPADARFSKCCGGTTELFSTCWQDLDIPYLMSFHDPYCDLSDMSAEARDALLSSILKDYDSDTDFYRWEKEVDRSLVVSNIKTATGRDIGTIDGISVLERGPSGRIKFIRFDGSTGSVTVGKELAIRRIFSDSHLYSSNFEIDADYKGFHLIGRGWGHGVGMCQIGAARMAAEGHGFEDILRFYYPGTILTGRK